MKNALYVLCLGVVIFGLSSCMSTPVFINEDDPEANVEGVNVSPVHFRSSKEFKSSPPDCIAVLPLKSNLKPASVKMNDQSIKPAVLTADQLKEIRWILYSHLAPFPYKDVELARVDEILKDSVFEEDFYKFGECDALLTGEITVYDTEFLGFYSQTSVGANLKLIKSKDNSILWKGRHIATSHAGGLPITPVDIALGIYNASTNIKDEQVVRVIDDLFRRLLSTWGNKNVVSPKTILVKKKVSPYSVTSKKLVIRSGPGKSYAAKSMLYQNDQVILISKTETPWVKVKLSDGRSGYVYGRYISEMNPVNLATKNQQDQLMSSSEQD